MHHASALPAGWGRGWTWLPVILRLGADTVLPWLMTWTPSLDRRPRLRDEPAYALPPISRIGSRCGRRSRSSSWRPWGWASSSRSTPSSTLATAFSLRSSFPSRSPSSSSSRTRGAPGARPLRVVGSYAIAAIVGLGVSALPGLTFPEGSPRRRGHDAGHAPDRCASLPGYRGCDDCGSRRLLSGFSRSGTASGLAPGDRGRHAGLGRPQGAGGRGLSRQMVVAP